MSDFCKRMTAIAWMVMLLLPWTVGCIYHPTPMAFDQTYRILDGAETMDLKDVLPPGRYCLEATDGKGLFHLSEPIGAGENLIMGRSFSTRNWVDVEDGELLKFNDARLWSEADKEAMPTLEPPYEHGTFWVGVDAVPGRYTVKGLDHPKDLLPFCKIVDRPGRTDVNVLRAYDVAHDVEVDAHAGEFIVLRYAVAELIEPFTDEQESMK